jgi:hypothetical protein
MKKLLLGLFALLQIIIGVTLIGNLFDNSVFASINFDTHSASTWLGNAYDKATATQVAGTVPVAAPVVIQVIPNRHSH